MIIGSTRIKQLFPDFREPKDLDIVVDTHKKRDNNTEYIEIPLLLKYKELNADQIYTLKVSHIFWDIKWWKHLNDIIFLQEKGCKLIPELFKDLYEYWNIFHGNNKRSNLKLSASDFFNNALTVYDHDSLHYTLTPEPIFLKVLKDGEEVDVCENKFNNLSYEDKIKLVKEEIYVMAYERKANFSFYEAYTRMFKKFLIEHAPLFEAMFIINNIKKLVEPDFDFILYFNKFYGKI